MSHVYNEVKETAGKMISGLRTYSDDFALKYLESYIATMVETYVKDDTERTMIQMRMLKIGIDSLIEKNGYKMIVSPSQCILKSNKKVEDNG